MIISETLSDGTIMTYSDLGVYIHGGSPESDYSVAYDPAGANRTYVETDVHIDMTDAEQYEQMAEVFANYGISPPPIDNPAWWKTAISMMRTVTARNITKYEDDGLTTIGANAFAYCKRFGGDLIFPNVRSIGAYAFQYIDSTVDTGHRIRGSFPACTAVGSHIFYHANRVTGCSLPLVTSLPESGFEYCPSIVQLDLPLVRTIGAAVFRSIPQCVSLDLPSLTACSGTINFQWNTKMTTITAPNCLIWSTNMFTGSTALKTFDMSNVNSDDFIQANRTAISGEGAPNAMNCVFSDKTMTYAQLKTAAANA